MDFNYYGDRHQIPEEEDRRRVRHQASHRLELRSTTDPFAISRSEFRRLYRMPQEQLLELARIIEPYMPARRGASTIPVELRVLCAVGFYAQGSYQRPHGRSTDLNHSQSSVSNSIEDVTNALNHPDILTRFIRFPLTREERDRFIQRNAVHGLDGVLVYIDGTLIKIVTPSDPDKHIYRCRKGFNAINVQIVCDSQLYIICVNSRFPGSASDPYIYRMTPVRPVMRAAFQENPCWLLGDSAYPHEPWLQTPILDAERGTPEYNYTKLHCRGRNCVERCIGVLKARWRCLLCDRTLHYAPIKAGKIANACAVLHNYLLEANIPNPPPLRENLGDANPEFMDPDELPLLQAAEDVRAYLVDIAHQRHMRMHHGD